MRARAATAAAFMLVMASSSACGKKPVDDRTPAPSAIPPTLVLQPVPTAPPAFTVPPVIVQTEPPFPSPPPGTQRPGQGSLLERARTAALENRPTEVRLLLGARVSSGHASPDEVALVKAACRAMADRTCTEEIKAKYP